MKGLAAFCAMALLGCGDEGSGPITLEDIDASIEVPMGVDPGTLTITAPEAPRDINSPDLIPEGGCPDGFVETTVAGIPACDPLPGDPLSCTGDEAHFIGTTECAVVGPACPSGDFPAEQPDTLYVRPGASGDGSYDNPFGTVAAARAVVEVGQTIQLAAGTYTGPFAVKAGTTLRGACTAQTILEPSSGFGGPGDPYAALLGDPDGVGPSALEAVTIRAAGKVGMFLVEGSGTVRDVVIDGAEGIGIEGQSVSGAPGSYTIENVVIRNVEPFSTSELLRLYGTQSGLGGYGISVQEIELNLDNVVIEDVHSTGVNANVDGTVNVNRVVVRRPRYPTAAGFLFGDCFTGFNGAELNIQDSACSGHQGTAIYTDNTPVTVDTLWIEDATTETDERLGWGVSVRAGGSISGSRVACRNLTGMALAARGNGAEIDLADVVVENIDEAPFDGQVLHGAGLFLADNAVGNLTRARITDIVGIGLYAVDPGSMLDATDVSLEGISLSSIGRGGSAVVSHEEATVVIEGMEARDVRRFGATLTSGGSMTLHDVRFSEIRAAAGRNGAGIAGDTESSLIAQRVVIEDAEGLGIWLNDTDATLHDIVVRDAFDVLTGLEGGRGITIFGGTTEMERAEVVGTDNVGLEMVGDMTFTGTDLNVSGSLFTCDELGCAQTPFGYAVLTTGAPTVNVRRFLFQHGGCGLRSQDVSGIVLEEGEIRDNSIGLCLNTPGSFLNELAGSRVRFSSNGLRMQANELPTPTVEQVLPELDEIAP